MRIGGRPRSGMRARGTARLPATTIESLTVTGAAAVGGSLTVTGLIYGVEPQSRLAGTQGVVGPSGALTLTADTMYAHYIGRAADVLSTTGLSAEVYVSGAAAVGAGWAELAVATGTYTPITSPTLTPRAYASIDSEVKAGATASYAKTLNLTGVTLGPADDLWLIVACNYATTQAQLRIHAGDGDRSGVSPRRAAGGRPSTALGSALAFTYTAGNAQPAIWGAFL